MIGDPTPTGSPLRPPDELTPSMPVAPSIPTFRALPQNRTLIDAALDEFGLHDFNPADFIKGNLQVEQAVDTNLIQATVRMNDPQLAAQLANEITSGAVRLNQRLSQDDTVITRDLIGSLVAEAETRLRDVEDDLLNFKRDAGVDLLRQEVVMLRARVGELDDERAKLSLDLTRIESDSADGRLAEARDALVEFGQEAQLEVAEQTFRISLDQKANLEVRRLGLLLDAQGLEAEVQHAEGEIAKRSTTVALERSLDWGALLVEAARGNDSQIGTLLGVTLQDEVLDPTFEALERAIVEKGAGLNGVRTRLAEVEDRLVNNAVALAELQADVVRKRMKMETRRRIYDLANEEYRRLLETSPSGLQTSVATADDAYQQWLAELTAKQVALHEREQRLDVLTVERELARGAYVYLADQHEKARIRVASRTPQLQIVDAAQPATAPIPSDVFLFVRAFLAGLAVLSLLALAAESSVIRQGD